MKRVLLVLGFIVATALLTVPAAQAQQAPHRPLGPPENGAAQKKTSPEIDPMVAGSVLTLLAGGMFVLGGRLRKKARAQK